MTTYFVTGTDTDVGKTVISALLVKQLEAHYWKPVQSGIVDIEDKNEVQRMTGISSEKIVPCVYELNEPLSPHEAARIDGVDIDMGMIEKPQIDGPLIIEGAGGVFVPLNDESMMIDLIQKMECEVIIVARSGLGTINHTLLTINALNERGIDIKGVILNGEINTKNKNAIEQFGKVSILGEVTYIKDQDFSKLSFPMFDL